MKSITAQTKNILNAYDAYITITEAALEGIPAMGMFSGKAGLGKTTAGAWLFCQADGILVRCLKADTLGTFLERLANDLGLDKRQRQADMIDYIVKELALAGKPLFIDEADYLAEKFNVLETIRDIYDLANIPIILIGYAELPRKLKRLPQLDSRISQHVEFEPADFEDTQIMATQLLENCSLEDDLIQKVLDESKGNFRRITVALSHIEKFCHVNNLTKISAAQWSAK
ncbi:AAA family ATPase [uncultured Paraglaciecola sp.]|mgnify:CR=1 FL=1|uniref:AAA family ATPase n=1 Tax=uncultured Paraglaciecola sp. TaxID=1765024 RepID=UPI002612E423|nr:ATP-binding protein [uncultured Paraglaciecola sp.]